LPQFHWQRLSVSLYYGWTRIYDSIYFFGYNAVPNTSDTKTYKGSNEWRIINHLYEMYWISVHRLNNCP
jgi:hypothetical protein